MDSIFFYNEDFTQAVIEKSTKIEDFNEFIKNSFGVEDFIVRYHDDEDDEITIKTQLELEEALNQAEAEVIFTVYAQVKEEEKLVEEYEEEILIEPLKDVFIEDIDEEEENDTSKDEEIKQEKGKEESKPVLKIPEPVNSILKQIGIDNAEEIANEYLDSFKNSDFIKNNTNVDKDGNIYVDINLPNIQSLPQDFNLDIPIDVVSNMIGENASQVNDYVQDIISNVSSSLEKKKEEENKIVHHNAICDGCDKRITGIRYKCVNCDDYDLCEACEATNFENNTHNPNHVFLKIYKPVDVHPQVPLPSFYLEDENVDQNSSSSSDNSCWFGRRRHCGRHFGHGHGRGRGMMRQKVESLEDRIKQLEERFVSLEKNNNNNKNKHNMSQEEKIERKLKRIEERKNFLLNRARKIKEEKQAKLEQERLAKEEEERLAKEEEEERIVKDEEEKQAKLEQERLAKEEAQKQAKLEQERIARQKIKEADELARKRAQQMRKEFLAKKEKLRKEQKQAKLEAQRDLSKIKFARQIDVLTNMGFVEEQFIDLLPKHKGNLDAILATLLA